MSNPSKRKGTRGENRAKLRFSRWWPSTIDRAPLRGTKDTGDLLGLPYVVSVKNCENWSVHKWLADLEKMRANADGKPGWVTAYRSRKPPVHIVPDDVMEHLLDAIYGGPE